MKKKKQYFCSNSDSANGLIGAKVALEDIAI